MLVQNTTEEIKMDKAMYKQVIADLMKTESELKSKLQIIEDIVKNTPNNMELGKSIRNLYWDKRDISE